MSTISRFKPALGTHWFVLQTTNMHLCLGTCACFHYVSTVEISSKKMNIWRTKSRLPHYSHQTVASQSMWQLLCQLDVEDVWRLFQAFTPWSTFLRQSMLEKLRYVWTSDSIRSDIAHKVSHDQGHVPSHCWVDGWSLHTSRMCEHL